MPLLNVTDEEWVKAEKFFKKNPNEVYKPKAGFVGQHSFVMVEGNLYAIANKDDKDLASGHVLGEGSFGRVKICQSRNGDNFAVKIEGVTKNLEQKNENAKPKKESKLTLRKRKKGVSLERSENQINKDVGLSVGGVLRKLPMRKPFKSHKSATHLKYTIQKKIPGRNLLDLVQDNKPKYDMFGNATEAKYPMSETQKLLIGLHCTKEIRNLHKRNILHRDIKPENFMVDLDGYNVTSTAIDFGMSAKLKFTLFGKKVGSIFKMGSPAFMSPEIEHTNSNENLSNIIKNVYSTSSDVYALGITLNHEGFGLGLKEPDKFFDKMLADNPLDRPKTSEVLNKLVNTLSKQPDYQQSIPSVAQALYESSPKRFKSRDKIEAVLNAKHEIQQFNNLLLKNLDKKSDVFKKITDINQELDKLNIVKYDNKQLEQLTKNLSQISDAVAKINDQNLKVECNQHMLKIREHCNELTKHSGSKQAKNLNRSAEKLVKKSMEVKPKLNKNINSQKEHSQIDAVKTFSFSQPLQKHQSILSEVKQNDLFKAKQASSDIENSDKPKPPKKLNN